MGVHIGDNQLVITAEPKTIHFDLSKDVDNNLKHETDFIIEHNEILSEQLLLKYRYRNDINEQHKFVLKLSQRLDFKSSNKHVDLQNLSIYDIWKSVIKQYKNKKLKIIASTWNNEFELPNGSYSASDIQD